MDNGSYNTIVGGLLALGGVFFGGALSFVIELLRRRWAVTDRKYERKKEIIDQRAEQAQKYAVAVTEDFRSVMHDAEVYFVHNDPIAAAQRDENRRRMRDTIDNSIFALGPAISTLADLDLKSHWELMMKSMDSLHKIYVSAWKYRIMNDQSIDPQKGLTGLNRVWLDFSNDLGNFYKRIDEIKLAASNK